MNSPMEQMNVGERISISGKFRMLTKNKKFVAIHSPTIKIGRSSNKISPMANNESIFSTCKRIYKILKNDLKKREFG